MNWVAIVILVTITIEFVLDAVSDYLNIQHLDTELPEEFSDVYDEEKYEQSQRYTKVRTKFGIFTSLFNLILLLGFWFAGGFEWLDTIVRSWGYGPLGTGLIFIALLMMARSILNLPFSIYSTFVIEEEFGFNKTTWKTFWLDRLKGIGLGLLLGGPLLAGILAFFQYGGPYAWVYAWAVVTVFTLILQFVTPRWIMPLFNDFTPLEDEELRQMIEDYAQKVKFPLQEIYVIDGSKRSSKSNAFFTGFGKNKRIALYDTLIENHTKEELLAVLAHEVGHFKHKHIIQNMVISVLQTGVMFLLLSIVLKSEALYQAFYVNQPSVYTGLIFFGMLYAPVEMLLSMIMQVISRKHEYQADAFAVTTTSTAKHLIDGLKKLSRDNLSNLTPHPFYVFLNYSHPPVLDRIRAMRKVEAKQ
ncbi:MAG: M48 family metallopeptidase [Bacteroidota bacterium]